MHRMKFSTVLQMFLPILMTLLLLMGGVEAVSAAANSWQIVPSPSPGTTYNSLSAVAAISARNVWAVGYYQDSGPEQALIEHWNGKQWSVVKSPNVGTNYNYLQGVTAISARDIWAVGSYTSSAGIPQTLIEHWNGQQWNVIASPNAGRNDALSAVAALSACNVWAVGYSLDGDRVNTLIEHWNGQQWSIVKSPNVGTSDNFLTAVTAFSQKNIWAVGYYFTDRSNIYSKSLIEHWDGQHWNIISHPNPGTSANSFQSVMGFSASDVWAVGSSASGTDYVSTLIEHWNGHQWKVVKSPKVGTSSSFYGVTALSTCEAWAVGSSFSASNPSQTLIMHWNGRQWSIVSSPNPGTNTSNTLLGVTSVPATSQLWAVGTSSFERTLIEFNR